MLMRTVGSGTTDATLEGAMAGAAALEPLKHEGMDSTVVEALRTTIQVGTKRQVWGAGEGVEIRKLGSQAFAIARVTGSGQRIL